MVRIRLEIEKNTLFGRAFVRDKVKNREKTPFVARLLDRVRAKYRKNTLLIKL